MTSIETQEMWHKSREMFQSIWQPRFRRWNMRILLFTSCILSLILLASYTDLCRIPRHPPSSVNVILALTKKDNDYSWTEKITVANFKAIPYIADDEEAEFHPPDNKGNEAIMYLTYLHDFYDNLPDYSIFTHGQESAWHNEGIHDYSTANTINRLDLSEVSRRGFLNLRVAWENACPAWINTSITKQSPTYSFKLKGEEPMMKEAFLENFPNQTLPEILSAPCCSQFALSKETILSVPKEQYKRSIDWLVATRHSNEISGRVWEHLWQYLFLKKAIDCPGEWESLCRNYHFCFRSREVWDEWRILEKKRKEYIDYRRAMLENGLSEQAKRVLRLDEKIVQLETRLRPGKVWAEQKGRTERGRRRVLEGGTL